MFTEADRAAAHAEYCRLVNLRSKAKGAEKREITKAMNAAYDRLRAMNGR